MLPFQRTNRAAFLNFLHSKYELYTGTVKVTSRPYYVGFDPSSICQLRCPTCPTGIDNENRRHAAEEKEFRGNRTMLNQTLFDSVLNELGEYLFLVMFYNWGEPLLNRELPEYVRKAKGLGIETDVNSNLSLHLSDEQIEELLCSGLDQLSASLDGFSQETYEMYRRGGNLELAKSNLERLAKARKNLGLTTKISWNFLVFGFNEHEVPAARRYCRTLGIEFNARDAYIDNPDWLPSYRKNESPMAKSPEWKEALVWSPLSRLKRRKNAPGCAWHYGYSMVNADGSVSPCCASWNQQDDFGRVVPGVTSFDEIWNNDLYQDARTAFSPREGTGHGHLDTICTRCPFGDGIQHLYSIFDVKVMMQYFRQRDRKDSHVDRAFELLGRARYGRAFQAVLRRGKCIPIWLLMKRNGNEQATSRFVEFYEKNLLDDWLQARQRISLVVKPSSTAPSRVMGNRP